MDRNEAQGVAQAIREAFISPNVPDANLEAANLMDTTNYLANGLSGLRRKQEANREAITQAGMTLAAGLHDIADAIREGRDGADQETG
jgi:hypothetical protein